MPDLDLAEQFLAAQGRILDRRRFERLFRGGDAAPVRDAVAAYRNADGGFGHGLEPDKRCPASLPIDVEIALQAYASAGADDPELLRRACDFLAGESVGGAVSLASPVIEDYPRAEHWSNTPARGERGRASSRRRHSALRG